MLIGISAISGQQFPIPLGHPEPTEIRGAFSSETYEQAYPLCLWADRLCVSLTVPDRLPWGSLNLECVLLATEMPKASKLFSHVIWSSLVYHFMFHDWFQAIRSCKLDFAKLHVLCEELLAN